MKQINLVLPHQLFEESPLIENKYPFYLLEEYLFFNQYNFHKQKIAFHHSTMKGYARYLKEKGKKVTFIESTDDRCKIQDLTKFLAQEGVKEIQMIHPTDNWIEKYLEQSGQNEGVKISYYESPLFLNSRKDNESFFRSDKKKFFQTTFYKAERVKRNILLEENDEPQGGKWTFDSENRKKYPADKTPPEIDFPKCEELYESGKKYVEKQFSNNYGSLGSTPIYPLDYDSARKWLDQFLKTRFREFGDYEDAIVTEESILNHSVLSPLINVGLLTPQFVIDQSIEYAKENDVPINSLEGFIRQIIGWREFIRGVYECAGSKERTTNFWNFKRKIPESFWDGSTGIPPVDLTIQKILKTGYCHHIERLMVIGNIMVLCEFDPDEVYRWFMELFIDAYDWVMVPNVYGMSQFADGGLMSTKPYFSSSNYLMKMSDYEKGDWQEIWDGLFWRFMHVYRDILEKNPRMNMLLGNLDRMSDQKLQNHIEKADKFIDSLTS